MVPSRETVSRILLTGAILCSLATMASAAVTSESKCAAGKIDLSGKYAACLLKAEKASVLTGDPGKYAAQLAKCEERLATKWAKLEAGTCWSEGDLPQVQRIVEATAWGVAKGVTLNSDPDVDSAYVTSVECFELLNCCIVKITYYNPNLMTNVTDQYDNCNTAHTWVKAE